MYGLRRLQYKLSGTLVNRMHQLLHPLTHVEHFISLSDLPAKNVALLATVPANPIRWRATTTVGARGLSSFPSFRQLISALLLDKSVLVSAAGDLRRGDSADGRQRPCILSVSEEVPVVEVGCQEEADDLP